MTEAQDNAPDNEQTGYDKKRSPFRGERASS
jgi:hypothetical protein